MLLGGVLVVLAALAGTAAPASPPAVATPAPAQARYDAAQSAYDRGYWAQAAAGFAPLLPSDPAKPLSQSKGVIAFRYADALRHLNRLDEAAVWIDRGVAALALADPMLQTEAWLVKADTARARYDYADAMAAYDKADALAAPFGASDALYRARTGLAFAGVTVDPAHVLERLRPLLADPAFKGWDKKALRAQVEDLAARAAINLGDKATADHLVKAALSDSGGLLTSTISVNQVAVMADAGIIARLRGDDEETSRDFTAAGAGHLKDMSWIADHSGELPICGASDSDVRPDDSAVINFIIQKDGSVAGTVPIYASRPGPVGVTFARAVSEWRWDPAKIAIVDPFWRTTLQLELRCVSRPAPQQLDMAARRTVAAWLEQRDLIGFADISTKDDVLAFSLAPDDPRLSRPDGVVLQAAAGPEIIDAAAMQALWARLEQTSAPPAAYALLIARWAQGKSVMRGGLKGVALQKAQAYAGWIPIFAHKVPQDDALGWLKLHEAFAFEDAGDFAAAQPVLADILATPTTALPVDEPVRKVALLHRAIGLQQAGSSQAARESLDQSGLTANECTLLDTHPVAESLAISSSAFPEEALRWRFEGYVQEAFDIDDQGSVKNVRTVVAYPPYIFETTTEAAVRHYKFYPPQLGGRTVGCEGETQAVRYRIGS